jgi:hypothetical protein
MVSIKNPLKTNGWYRAYRKRDAKMITVKCLGMTNDGIRFADREERTYSPNDFYFWKSTGEAS